MSRIVTYFNHRSKINPYNNARPDDSGSKGIAVEWAGGRKLLLGKPKQQKTNEWGLSQQKKYRGSMKNSFIHINSSKQHSLGFNQTEQILISTKTLT